MPVEYRSHLLKGDAELRWALRGHCRTDWDEARLHADSERAGRQVGANLLGVRAASQFSEARQQLHQIEVRKARGLGCVRGQGLLHQPACQHLWRLWARASYRDFRMESLG